MPELPEVTTTVRYLQKVLPKQRILSVWTDYHSPYFFGTRTIKDPAYFSYFKKAICGLNIVSVTRIGKNILVHLSNKNDILIHMKMTGHLLYAPYKKTKHGWISKIQGPLQDTINQHIHAVFSLSSGNHLALSDVRKFAKITLLSTGADYTDNGLAHIGPDPTNLSFTVFAFKKAIMKKPNGNIKTVLMDQKIVSGIGNIYSDEALWLADIHPKSIVKKIPDAYIQKLLRAIKTVLSQGIHFEGDSTSDYRKPDGKPGQFHHRHNVYQKTGTQCQKAKCRGTIKRIALGGRGAHFCTKHQIQF